MMYDKSKEKPFLILKNSMNNFFVTPKNKAVQLRLSDKFTKKRKRIRKHLYKKAKKEKNMANSQNQKALLENNFCDQAEQ